MSNYSCLKREKSELQGQLRLLKTQLEEAQEENRFLHAGTDLTIGRTLQLWFESLNSI